MTTALDITDTESTALADLAVRAPSTLRSSVLVEVGLMDRYGRIDGSPLGPLVVAWNGIGVVSSGPGRGRRSVRGAASRGHGPPGHGFRGPDSPGERDRSTARGRSASPHPARPSRSHRLRAGRLAQGPRDPAWRGPAVRLDRGGDRSAEGGPCRRHRARPQPGAAHRPVPPRGPEATASSVSTRWVARRTSGRSWRRRASTPRRWRRRAPWRAARRLRVHEDRLLADVPYGPAHARAEPAAVPLARRGGPRPVTGRARSAGRSSARRLNRSGPRAVSHATATLGVSLPPWTSRLCQPSPTAAPRPGAWCGSGC